MPWFGPTTCSCSCCPEMEVTLENGDWHPNFGIDDNSWQFQPNNGASIQGASGRGLRINAQARNLGAPRLELHSNYRLTFSITAEFGAFWGFKINENEATAPGFDDLQKLYICFWNQMFCLAGVKEDESQWSELRIATEVGGSNIPHGVRTDVEITGFAPSGGQYWSEYVVKINGSNIAKYRVAPSEGFQLEIFNGFPFSSVAHVADNFFDQYDHPIYEIVRLKPPGKGSTFFNPTHPSAPIVIENVRAYFTNNGTFWSFPSCPVPEECWDNYYRPGDPNEMDVTIAGCNIPGINGVHRLVQSPFQAPYSKFQSYHRFPLPYPYGTFQCGTHELELEFRTLTVLANRIHWRLPPDSLDWANYTCITIYGVMYTAGDQRGGGWPFEAYWRAERSRTPWHWFPQILDRTSTEFIWQGTFAYSPGIGPSVPIPPPCRIPYDDIWQNESFDLRPAN